MRWRWEVEVFLTMLETSALFLTLTSLSAEKLINISLTSTSVPQRLCINYHLEVKRRYGERLINKYLKCVCNDPTPYIRHVRPYPANSN